LGMNPGFHGEKLVTELCSGFAILILWYYNPNTADIKMLPPSNPIINHFNWNYSFCAFELNCSFIIPKLYCNIVYIIRAFSWFYKLTHLS
jgi:hypothetical protein